MARIEKKVLDNRCPRCQAPIEFNPKLGLFKCDYCDGKFTAEELKDMTTEENKVPVLNMLIITVLIVEL